MTSEAAKPRGLLAFDLEATGSGNSKDLLFAVGFAHIPLNNEILDSANPARSEQFKSHLRKQCIVLDLHKPADADWRHFWVSQGFCIKTYDEFWSQHLPVLDQLQAASSASSEQLFADLINAALGTIESKYSSVTLLSDTLTFDVPALSMLLAKYGHRPLCTSRSGTFQSGFEVDSYISGVLNLSITSSWQDIEEARAKALTPLRSLPRLHDHNPENDAVAILDDFVTACSIAKAQGDGAVVGV